MAQRAEEERRARAAVWEGGEYHHDRDWLNYDRLEAPPTRSQIQVSDRNVGHVAEEALNALLTQNDPPRLFNQGGSLVGLCRRPGRAPAVTVLTTAELKGQLEFAAFWVRERQGKSGTSRTQVAVPYDVANALMARRPWHYLPSLRGVVSAPVYSEDGRIHARGGYWRGTRLYYHVVQPVVPPQEVPTTEEVVVCLMWLLDHLLCDFPFADSASLAHAVALILLPFVREMIPGPTPLHVIDATGPGVGKSLLADVCTRVFVSHGVPVTTAPADGDEWRKKITSLLGKLPSHVWLDNLPRKLVTAELAAALTATTWEDRVLGQSAMVEYPVRCVWLATGNNVRASDEIARRSVWIRLTPREEAPWTRTGFRHDPLIDWLLDDWPVLVHSCLVLVQHWLANGAPRADVRMGSYQAWAEVMGGILQVAGVPGFLANRDALMVRLDTERAELREFLELWHGGYGLLPTGVSQLYQLLDGTDLLAARLGDGTDRSRRIRLGHLLASYEEQIVSGFQIKRSGERNHAARYCLVTAEPDAGEAGKG